MFKIVLQAVWLGGGRGVRRRDSIPDGLGQCAAEMVASQRFNQRAGNGETTIFGCVTTGANWKFLRLEGHRLDIDIDEYSILQPERILGVLLHCCGVTLAPAP